MRSRSETPSFVNRHYPALAAAALVLAAFNLTFRLGSEIVTEWDESLYAITAAEIVACGHWIGTTFMGALDYYNTKPPLNVWLIALSFKAFGSNLVSLRLPSIVAAWLTVAILQIWARRTLGSLVALLSSLVLSTTFGFIYDHAGRSANTDALFTLLVLLAVVTCWAARERPWRLAWLGPLTAAVFLLRGMAVLLPISIVAAVELRHHARSQRERWLPLAAALALFLLPVTAWIVARWRLDQWQFIERLFVYDFLARSLTVIEDHPGSPLYYLNILQRNQFDWMAAAVAAAMIYAIPHWNYVRSRLVFWRSRDVLTLLIGTWAALTLLIPTLMRTKLSWYLNSFYPPFAVVVACVFAAGLAGHLSAATSHRRKVMLVLLFVVTITAAESRLMWYSYHRRALTASSQGLLLAERRTLEKQTVFGDHWTHSEVFVLKAIVGAEHREINNLEEFLRNSRIGDYFFSPSEVTDPDMLLVRSNGRHRLYRRRGRG